MTTPFFLVLELWALHFLLDFPLQGDFLARAKNHVTPLPGIPWGLCLFAHAFLQAAGVALVLPLAFGAAELVSHFALDYAKNAGVLGTGERAFVIDQLAHLALKAAYVGAFLWVLT